MKFFLKFYIIGLLTIILIVKLISIITKKYLYGIKYAISVFLIFYLPILIYVIFL